MRANAHIIQSHSMPDPQATVQPRKKPAQARSRATVEAILEAATRILRDQGLAGLTTNRVAERAGVSVGSLYQYFPGKEALLAALIEREASADLEALRGLFEGSDALPLGVAIVTQLLLLLARHAQSCWVITSKLTVPPSAPMERKVGATV